MLTLVLALLFLTPQAPAPAAADVVSRGRAAVAALGEKNFASIEAQFTDQMKGTGPSARRSTRSRRIVAEDVIRDVADWIRAA